ncbi:MAG TPA: cupin [Gammaproteobacteria bacterium]|nr:cupin [Gammaproteobacteria bacterium]
MQVIIKPWGKEEIIEINDRYMLKKLTMWKGNRCSLQYHNIKRETVYVLSGKLRIYSGPSQDQLESKIFESSESITLIPGIVHRMEAIEDSVYIEASTPELTDVVRLIDDYQRTEP